MDVSTTQRLRSTKFHETITDGNFSLRAAFRSKNKAPLTIRKRVIAFRNLAFSADLSEAEQDEFKA